MPSAAPVEVTGIQNALDALYGRGGFRPAGRGAVELPEVLADRLAVHGTTLQRVPDGASLVPDPLDGQAAQKLPTVLPGTMPASC